MSTYEYTYLWWEGSTTGPTGGRELATPPIGEEVIDKINSLAAERWELDTVTAAPLTTGWVSPGGRFGVTSFTDKVHYLAMLRRPRLE
jgi:hypothetical protein